MMYKLNKRLLTGIVKCLVPSNRMDIRCCHSINGPSKIMELERRVVVNPRASAIVITNSPKHIKVHKEGITRLKDAVVPALISKELQIANFSQSKYHPKASDAWALDQLFVIDTLNFCFWSPPGQPKWTVCNESGYFALCAAISRAMQNGIEIWNPAFYANINFSDLEDILRGDDSQSKIPLLDERFRCLRQVGRRLHDKYGGRFANVVQDAGGSAKRLLRIICDEFPCFRDDAEWGNVGVSLYKRAQILIGDIWACFEGKGPGHFEDIDELTMFADYRVPQVLVHFGAMSYDDHLMELLSQDKILENGSAEEVEIRGVSIFIVEELKKAVVAELNAKHPDYDRSHVNSVLLDHFLWDYRRRHAKDLEHIPFHKTLSVYY